MNRDNSRALVRDSEEQQSDLRGQGGIGSESTMLQRQYGSISDFHSLAELVKESSSTFDTKRTILRVVDSLDEERVSGIFRESLEVPNFLGSLELKHWVRGVLLSKLVSVNLSKAQELIEQLDEPDLESVLYGVMREWSPVYTERAIKLLSTFDGRVRSLGLQGLIAGRHFLSHADLIEIGTELGIAEEYTNRLFDWRQLAIQPMSLDDLETTFEKADVNDHLQLIQLRRKAARYVLAEGLDSLPDALELFDRVPTEDATSLSKSMVRIGRTRLISSVSAEDPARVFDFVLGLDEDIDVDLLSAVSEVWFASDPDELWYRLQEEDVKNYQAEITESVIDRWARNDPHLTLVSLNRFPAEYHDEAYLAIANTISQDAPLEALALLPLTGVWPETPMDLESMTDVTSLRSFRPNYEIRSIVSAAAKSDPVATIEWLNSDESQLDESTRQQYLDTVFESWATDDPESAFEVALLTPVKEGSTALEATVVQWLAYRDVDRAITLLPRVREGESKLDVYKSIAGQLEEEDRIADAIQLGEQLPEDQKEDFLQRLSLNVAHRAPYSHLEAGIKQLPTTDLQSRAAQMALMFSGSIVSPELTDQERGQLKEFLTDDDKEMVEMMENVDMDSLKKDVIKNPAPRN